MQSEKIKVKSEKVIREKKIRRALVIVIFVFLLLLLIAYLLVGIIYNSGNFSITLDKNLYYNKGLLVYDDVTYKAYRSELYAAAPEKYDNVSFRWLPNNLDGLGGGSHNGRNYLAYTFFVENRGEEVADYWSAIVIDDVIKNVDDAVRIRVYKNGEATTYAKVSAKGTLDVAADKNFLEEDYVMEDHVENFKPGDIDRYTVVMWLEGNDPECTDNILGGEFKAHMQFNSEHVDYEEGEENEK